MVFFNWFWFGVKLFVSLGFFTTVKRSEDFWFDIGFYLVKRSDLRFVVPRSALWSGGWASFCSSVWLSSISSVGGLSSLEAHPLFI